MHRARDAEAFRPVRGAYFVNGIAVMKTSGGYGKTATRAGIVGHVDLRLGSAAHDMLQAHIRAPGGSLERHPPATVLACWHMACYDSLAQPGSVHPLRSQSEPSPAVSARWKPGEELIITRNGTPVAAATPWPEAPRYHTAAGGRLSTHPKTQREGWPLDAGPLGQDALHER